MSTFKEMQDEVLEHQLNDNKYRPSIKRWLNEAQARIARQASVRALYASTNLSYAAGTPDGGLPADYARKVELADSTDPDNWRVLFPMELADFDALPESAGAPTNYVIIGDILYLYPTPDVATTIALSYFRLPAEMSADSDTPEIPSDYHYLLPYWALYRAFMRENDIEQSTTWKNEWLTELEKMKGEMHYEGQDVPRQVPGTYEDGAPVSPSQWQG
jgi:hypothetical protein